MAGGRRRKGRKMDRKIKAIENALWTRRGKTIVTKNLNRWRRSPSLASDIYELDRCVVEYQSDDELVLYDADRYKRIRAHLLSEQYALTGAPYTED